MSPRRTPVETHVVFAIAVEAEVDPRSVRKELITPSSVRGLAGERIRRALKSRGLASLALAHTPNLIA